jgi:hypothetical protein
MKLRMTLLGLLALVAFVASGCSLVQGVTGRNAGTVAALWSDVPQAPGATKANIDIPLPVQFIVQAFMQAANSDSSNDTKLDKFDFVVYTTADTPQKVGEFYTKDKMTAAGWDATDTPGCAAGTDTSGTTSGAGGFCAFGKKGDAGKQTVLLIIPVQEDSTKQTQIFYVRFEGTKKTK